MAGNSDASSKAAQEPLELIPESSFTELSNILRQDFPDSLTALGLVQNVIRWRKNTSIPQDHNLYAPYGDFKNGSFVGIYNMELIQIITFYARDANDQKFREALLTTGLINWSSKNNQLCMIWEIPDKLLPIFKEIVTKNNIKGIYKINVHFMMEKEDAIKLDVRCPPGVTIRPLTLDHAPYLNQHWTYKFNGSQEFLRSLVERNFGLGVFVEGNDMPVTWITVNQNSLMVILHTVDGHRKKGYAELVCNAMTKKLAEMDIYPRATVLEANQASIGLFKKMGYKISHVVHFIDSEFQ